MISAARRWTFDYESDRIHYAMEVPEPVPFGCLHPLVLRRFETLAGPPTTQTSVRACRS